MARRDPPCPPYEGGNAPDTLVQLGCGWRPRAAWQWRRTVAPADAAGCRVYVGKIFARDEHLWTNAGEFEWFGCCRWKRVGAPIVPAAERASQGTLAVEKVARDDQVWTILAEFEVPRRTTTDGMRISANRIQIRQLAALWGVGRRGRMPRLRRKDSCARMIMYGQMPGNLSGSVGCRGEQVWREPREARCTTRPPLTPLTKGGKR